MIEKRVTETSDERHYVEEKLDRLDQESKAANLRVFQVKEIPHENTRELIKQVFQSHMAVKLTDKDIESCYRIGKKDDGKNRSIFLKLADIEKKQDIYGRKKLLKGTGVVVKEDLTTKRLKLLTQAVERVGLRNTWTHKEDIFVNANGKVMIIKNQSDIASLVSK
nr:unnamed protein product [Callosobruchus analis]